MAAAMTEQQIPKLTFTVCDDGDENLHLSTSDDDSTGSNNNIEDGEVEKFKGTTSRWSVLSDQQKDMHPKVFNFSESEENPAGPDPIPYTPPDTEGMPASLKLALPRLLDIRKMSDQGIRHLRNHIRRVSNFTRLPRSWNKGENPVTTTGGHLEAHPGPRRMSMVDGCSVGILKAGSPLGGIGGGGGLHREGSTARLRAMLPNHLKLSGSRKTVSFCQRDNVTVYDSWEADDEDEPDVAAMPNGGGDQGKSPANNKEGESSSSAAGSTQLETRGTGLPELRGKSLIPTFGFNCKRPNYAQIFEENVLLLESLNITEDFCLMGNIRVNMTKLRGINREQESASKSITVRQRASVFAIYSFDSWNTVKETKAMVVKAQPHPSLKAYETHAMRFYIDCDDMEVGDTVEFAVVCSDRRQTVKAGTKVTKKLRTGVGNSDKVTTVVRKYRDDNEGQFYSCKCTRQLNAWAEKAARELKNVTPIIKYNKKY